MSPNAGRQLHPRINARRSTRIAGVVAAASALAASGCAIITQLSNDNLSLADVADGSTDATSPPDAPSMVEDAGPLPDVAVPCTFDDAGGWQIDCRFGNGGFGFIEEPVGAAAPILSLAADRLLVASGLPDLRDSVVYLYTPAADGTMRGSFVIAATSNAGQPIGLQPLPIAEQGHASALLLSDTPGGGLALTLLGGPPDAAPLAVAAAPAGSTLNALAIADSDDRGMLVVVNHVTKNVNQTPALVTLSFTGDPAIIFDIPLDAGADAQPVVSQSTTPTGGWIGTKTSDGPLSGPLYRLALSSPDASEPTIQQVLAVPGFFPSAIHDVNDSNVIAAAGPLSDGGLGAFVYGSGDPFPTPAVVPGDVSTVRLVADGVGYVAVALEASANAVMMARFLAVDGGGAVLDPSFANGADGGVAIIMLPESARTTLGDAVLYGADICFGLQIQSGDPLVGRNMVICTRSGTNAFAVRDAGGTDAAASDAGAADSSTSDAGPARDAAPDH